MERFSEAVVQARDDARWTGVVKVDWEAVGAAASVLAGLVVGVSKFRRHLAGPAPATASGASMDADVKEALTRLGEVITQLNQTQVQMATVLNHVVRGQEQQAERWERADREHLILLTRLNERMTAVVQTQRELTAQLGRLQNQASVAVCTT